MPRARIREGSIHHGIGHYFMSQTRARRLEGGRERGREGGVIKISPSISSFPLPPFQKQPSEHDTRGRRSSLFAPGRRRRREKGISIRLPPPPPPLHYLHKSCLCRRRHVCCERHGAALSRPPAAWSPVRQLVTLRPRSVGLWRERRGNYVYLLWFVYPLYPSLCPMSLASSSAFRLASSLLFARCGSMWLRWSMRRRRSADLGCGIAKSHFENSSGAAADQSDGRKD